MLRVIFDTNIYGLLIKEKNIDEITNKIKEDKEFKIYNYIPIRKEIRNIPKRTKESKRARILILQLYDSITEEHILKESIKIGCLAKKYYDNYREHGGIYGWDTNIRIDFMIVACAVLNELDIVYSDDKHTMLSKPALKSYKHINLKENLRTPNFYHYNDLLFKFKN